MPLWPPIFFHCPPKPPPTPFSKYPKASSCQCCAKNQNNLCKYKQHVELWVCSHKSSGIGLLPNEKSQSGCLALIQGSSRTSYTSSYTSPSPSSSSSYNSLRLNIIFFRPGVTNTKNSVPVFFPSVPKRINSIALYGCWSRKYVRLPKCSEKCDKRKGVGPKQDLPAVQLELLSSASWSMATWTPNTRHHLGHKYS